MSGAERDGGPRALDDAELEAEQALALPDRQAMSVVSILPYPYPLHPDPPVGPIADPQPDPITDPALQPVESPEG